MVIYMVYGWILSLMSSRVGGLTLSEAAEVKNVTQSRTVLSIGMK